MIEMTDPRDDQSKLDIDWMRTVAGALAAVTTAVLLSTLGAAGTLIGAAVGSVAATLGTALYSHGLRRSRRTVARAQELARQKVGYAQAEVRRAQHIGDAGAVQSHLQYAEARLDQAAAKLDLATAGTAPTWGERLRTLPWTRIVLVSAGLFVVVVALLSVFELVSGRPVSAITGGSDGGGTTLSRVIGTGGGDDTPDQHHPSTPTTPAGTPAGSPTTEPTTGPTGTPTTEPTSSPTTEPTTGTTGEPTPTSEPTAEPTQEPSQEPTTDLTEGPLEEPGPVGITPGPVE